MMKNHQHSEISKVDTNREDVKLREGLSEEESNEQHIISDPSTLRSHSAILVGDNKVPN